MMNTTAAAEFWNRTRAALVEAFPEIDDETLADTLEGLSDAKDLAESLILASQEDEAMAKGLAEYIAALNDRKARLVARAEKREAAALSLLVEIGEKTLRRGAFTASVVPTPRKVQFTDTSILPAWAWKTPAPVVDAAAVKARLATGETVPGAVLSNGGQTLRVVTR